jgi:hypothetical protein
MPGSYFGCGRGLLTGPAQYRIHDRVPRVRIAYANVASISTATVTAVTPRLTSSGPQLIRGRQRDR